MASIAVAWFAVFAIVATAAHAEPPPRFGLPIDCEIGPGCFVQKYVDHRKGKGYQDYHCGFLTDDGHGGTDFRLRDFTAIERGVAVLAAAAGRVRNVRDGMPDVDVRVVGKNAVDDRGLGNAVVVDHGGGWRTIYGHMRRGSVTVAEGQRVAAGQKLGTIGLSGATEFPHVHFEVRFGQRIVDPFVGLKTQSGCDSGEDPLWRPDVFARLEYRPTFLLRSGFSDRPMTRAALQYGLYERDTLPRKRGSLYFGVFVAGLFAGDRLNIALADQNGKTLRQAGAVVNQPAAVQFRSLAWKRNAPLPAGRYTARFTLHRAKDEKPRAVIDISRDVTLR